MTQMTKLINSSLVISLKDLESVFLMKNFIIFGLASYTKNEKEFLADDTKCVLTEKVKLYFRKLT